MITKTRIKLLVPSTSYGNFEIDITTELDTSRDASRIESELTKEGIKFKHGEISSESMQKIANKLTLDQALALKSEFDELPQGTFVLAK